MNLSSEPLQQGNPMTRRPAALGDATKPDVLRGGEARVGRTSDGYRGDRVAGSGASRTRHYPRRVLFLTSSEEDYLSDGLLLGLRTLLPDGVIDYPRRDVLYADCPESVRAQVRGNGFTLYTGLLRSDTADRFSIRPKLERGDFDLIVVSDIWRQFGVFAQWRQYLNPRNTILLDGADTPQVYPYAGLWLRRPHLWLSPRATRGFLYFKREWTEDSRFDLWHRLLPRAWRRCLPHYRGLRTVSFSIPEEKLVRGPTAKRKTFARHLVDPEIAARVEGAVTSYAFRREEEYYNDLREARFCVTTKRAGWDCLRHYEIAANGCVPCFRDLQLKPATCAPHGLVDGENCLMYSSADELFSKVTRFDAEAYDRLRTGALDWARTYTSTLVADRMLGEWSRAWNRPPQAPGPSAPLDRGVA